MCIRDRAYTGEVTEGQSGSPVWVQRDGQYVLVGIVAARGQVNIVVRVTPDFVRQLGDWIGTKQKEVLEEGLEDLENKQGPESEGLWDSSWEQHSTSLNSLEGGETETLETLDLDRELIEAWTAESTKYEAYEELYLSLIHI